MFHKWPIRSHSYKHSANISDFLSHKLKVKWYKVQYSYVLKGTHSSPLPFIDNITSSTALNLHFWLKKWNDLKLKSLWVWIWTFSVFAWKFEHSCKLLIQNQSWINIRSIVNSFSFTIWILEKLLGQHVFEGLL